MKNTLLATFVLVSSVSFNSMDSLAGDINQPTHIPNKATNKITQIKLRGLLADDVFQDEVDGRIQSGGLNSIGSGGLGGLGSFGQSGCNLNVGNSVGDRTLGDRDVIITGDVINVCQ